MQTGPSPYITRPASFKKELNSISFLIYNDTTAYGWNAILRVSASTEQDLAPTSAADGIVMPYKVPVLQNGSVVPVHKTSVRQHDGVVSLHKASVGQHNGVVSSHKASVGQHNGVVSLHKASVWQHKSIVMADYCKINKI